MTDPRIERDLREVLGMDAPDGAPTSLRERVRADLARESTGRGRAPWLAAAAAALIVALGAIVVVGPSIGPPPAGSQSPAASAEPPRTSLSETPAPPEPTLPILAEPIVHPGLLVNGLLIDRNHGWATSENGNLLLTGSGGSSWRVPSLQRGPANGGELQAWFLDAAHGWLVESFTHSNDLLLWHTVDGGAVWQGSAISGLGDVNWSLGFIDEHVGWLGTDPGGQNPKPELRWTDDGGATWSEPIDAGAATGEPTFPFSIEFVDRDRGFLSDDVSIRGTEDGGRSWSRVELPAPPDVRGSLHFGGPRVIDHDHLVVRAFDRLEDSTEVGSFVFASDDAGATWQVAEEHAGEDDRSISFIDALNWIASDGKTVWRTSNGGQSWESALVSGLPKPFRSFSIVMVDLEVGLGYVMPGSACIDFGCTFTTRELFKTIDGGQTWTRLGDCDPKSTYRFVCLGADG